MHTVVRFAMATPNRKISRSPHPRSPLANRMYAAPAGKWVVPNSAMPGMTMVGAKTMQNHSIMLGV